MKKMVFAIFLAAAFLFIGCDSKEESKNSKEAVEVVENRASMVSEAEERVSKENANMEKAEAGDEAVDAAKEVEEKILNATNEAKQKVEEVEKSASETDESIEGDIKSSVDEKINALTQVAKEAESTDTKALFDSKCAGCHGKNGKKVALGKGKPLSGQSKEELIDKMVGYKDGSYGGSMKQIMTTQVSNLTQEQIEALADYISKL